MHKTCKYNSHTYIHKQIYIHTYTYIHTYIRIYISVQFCLPCKSSSESSRYFSPGNQILFCHSYKCLLKSLFTMKGGRKCRIICFTKNVELCMFKSSLTLFCTFLSLHCFFIVFKVVLVSLSCLFSSPCSPSFFLAVSECVVLNTLHYCMPAQQIVFRMFQQIRMSYSLSHMCSAGHISLSGRSSFSSKSIHVTEQD